MHQAALRDKFFELKLNENWGTVKDYAQLLPSAALALSNGMPEDVLLHRHMEDLPVRLKDQVHLVTGSFGEVVTSWRRLFHAQIVWESVPEIPEEIHSTAEVASENRYWNYLCHFCGCHDHIDHGCTQKRTQGKEARDPPKAQELILLKKRALFRLKAYVYARRRNWWRRMRLLRK